MMGRRAALVAAGLMAALLCETSGCTVATAYLQGGSKTSFIEEEHRRILVRSDQPGAVLVSGEERAPLATEARMDVKVRKSYRRRPYWTVVAAGLLSLAASTAAMLYFLEEGDFLPYGVTAISFGGADFLMGGGLSMGVITFNQNRVAKEKAVGVPIEQEVELVLEWPDGVRRRVQASLPGEEIVVVEKPLAAQFEGVLIDWAEGSDRELQPEEALAVARAYRARAALGGAARDLAEAKRHYEGVIEASASSDELRQVARTELAGLAAMGGGK